MKTTRRHELQTNELADSLAHWIEAVRPYSRAALALLVAVVVAIFAWSYLSSQSQRKSAEGWNALYSALDSNTAREDLVSVAARYSDTSVGAWARVTLADVLANEGTNQLLTDKGAAREQLRQAAEEYQAVLLESRDPMLLQRATFGLARAHEAQGTPDGLASARKEYLSIGQQWADSPYKQDADERAAALDEASTKDFYDWLARYEPPRSMVGQPGIPGAKPDFLSDPLEDSGAKLPSAIDDSSALPEFGSEPSAGPSLGEEPAAEAPAETSPAAADEAAPPAPSETDKPAESEPK
ncbi:MAG: hypothetical protein WD845_17010 [Pirellulales bacterium]